tara:strand:- start:520 stop:1029 length:510 start_codon:yes stop_codon:yes gene_type:complete
MVLQAARELGVNVVPEGGMNSAMDLSMVIDGHTTIEHNIPILLEEDCITMWSRSSTAYTPTLIVSYGDLWGEIWGYQNENAWEEPLVQLYSPQASVQAVSMRRTGADDRDYYHMEVSRVVKAMADAGVNVQLGAHGQQQGLGYFWEMTFFNQGRDRKWEMRAKLLKTIS